MLCTKNRNRSILRRADAEVEASERLAQGEVNLVACHRELPVGLDAHFVEWAKRFPAQFDELVAMPNYDLSAVTVHRVQAQAADRACVGSHELGPVEG